MIERIVFIRLTDEAASGPGLQEVAAHSLEVLRAIPGVVSVAVGVAADERTGSSWHLCLRLELGSTEDVEAYRVHPDHRRYVDEYLRPKLAGIEAFNFEGRWRE